jgi:hypothetical protein
LGAPFLFKVYLVPSPLGAFYSKALSRVPIYPLVCVDDGNKLLIFSSSFFLVSPRVYCQSGDGANLLPQNALTLSTAYLFGILSVRAFVFASSIN